ncbi:MAG: SdrD B-like domain-containing protein [Spirosomataceae bacterium]
MDNWFTLLGGRAISLHNTFRSNTTKKPYLKSFALALGLILWANLTNAQISGTVYRDFNANGVKDNANEIGLGGIAVKITSSNGVVTTGTTIAGTTTATFASRGTFSITPSGTAPFRVEFSTFPTGHYSAPKGSQSGTSVQFVAAATTSNVNLGINYPSDYCEATPRVAVPCYVNGNPLLDIADNSKEAGLSDALVSFPYNSSGSTPTNVELSLANAIGSTWGLAYGKQSKMLFASAVMKRHTGFGPGGTGAIYKISNATTTTNFPGTSTFLNLNNYTLGGVAINTGTDPHSGLPGDKSQSNLDNASFDKVGRISFGDLEINEKEDSLFVVNLNDKKLYAIYLGADPANPTAPTTGAADSKIKAFTIPNPNCNGAANGDYIPWGLKVYHGVLYVGVVCTAQTSQNKADLKATVYALNLSTGAFTEVLLNNSNTTAIPLDFARGSVYCNSTATNAQADWRPWRTTNVDVNVDGVIGGASCISIGLITYPQPILSDIEFDADGSMIIGFADRLGNQTGRQNQDKNGTLFSGFSQGDLLRAFPNGNQWKIENNGTVNGFEGIGKANIEGPGGGEFYGGVRSSGLYTPIGDETADHAQASQGGLTVKNGSGQVMTTIIDPTYTNASDVSYWSGGVRRLNGVVDINTASTTNNGKRSDNDYLIYDSSDPLVGSFGKANGLGDLEVMCGLQPIEIGNRVWSDVNGNGIQDPNESGIGGITVKLYKGGVLVATTTTSSVAGSLGEYYFNASNVTGGLLPNMAYEIRIELNQSALTAFDLTTKDASSNSQDEIDSDFTNTSGVATLAVTTGSYGANNHTYDCGFNNCPSITKVTPDPASQICNGETVTFKVSTNATNLPYTAIEFVRFTSQQANPYTSVDASKTSLGSYSIPANNTATITASITTNNLPSNGSNNVTYYIYACVKPAPANPNCVPRVEYIIISKPNPSLTATNNSPVCEGGSINLSATISVVSASTYSWSGPNFASGLSNPSLANATTSMQGVYSVVITATNSCTASATTSVSVLTKPVVNVSASGGGVGCVGSSITLSASGGTSYTWSGPNNFSATIANPTISPLALASAGSYSVTVKGSNNCTATATASLSVNPSPSLQASGSIVCEGQTLNLSSSGGTSYTWTGPNSYNSNSQNPALPNATTAMSGTYTVTAANSANCTISVTTTASVNPKPVITANSSGPACVGGSVTLSASGGTSYTWTGPNSYSASGANPAITSLTTANQGIYTVIGINGFNCTASATTSIVVNTKPTVVATASSPICEGSSINLSASGGSSYSWSGPNFYSSTQQNPVLSPATTTMTGTYSVTASAASSCSASATVSVTVNTKPSLQVSSNSPLCLGNTLNLFASGGTSYSWSGPNSFNTAQQNPVLTNATTSMAGVYSVSVTNSNSCSNSATTSVSVVKIVASVSSNAPICSGATLTLSASGGTSYSWTGD